MSNAISFSRSNITHKGKMCKNEYKYTLTHDKKIYKQKNGESTNQYWSYSLKECMNQLPEATCKEIRKFLRGKQNIIIDKELFEI